MGHAAGSLPFIRPTPMHGPSRTRLPKDRAGTTAKVEFGTKAVQDLYITVNFFEAAAGADDVEARCKPAEIFVKVGRTGDVVTGLIEGFTLTLSVALQYGVPWDVLREKYLGTSFGDSDDKYTSYLDVIAKTVDRLIEQRRRELGD